MKQQQRTSIRVYGILILAVLPFSLWNCAAARDYPDALYSEEGHDISFYIPPESTSILANPPEAPLRNIILCIGDGMGINQVAMARYQGAGVNRRLWMERLPYSGLVCTHNADGEITDSAAAITAICCGVKTQNHRLGQTPDGTAWMTIAERLQKEGYRIGEVVTCTMSHATPAGFSAHIPDRERQADIAVQMLHAGFDVLLGGGRKYWLPESVEGSARKDDQNLLAEAKKEGYQIVENRKQLNAVSAGRVIGLLEEDALTTVEPEPSLADMTAAALRILTAGTPAQDSPFLMLIEGSQIDWACHINNENACVRQTLLFDLAVRQALNFAAADRHTLVLVTADHETGGLILLRKDQKLKAKWTTKDHSAGQVPILAFGPGAEQFTGIMDNTEISAKLIRLLGLDGFPRPLQEAPAAEQAEEKVSAASGL